MTNNTLKIRQTVALFVLCLYFFVKVISFFSTPITVVPQEQAFEIFIGSGHGKQVGDECGRKSVVDGDQCFYEWIYNWNVRAALGIMLQEAGIDFHFVNTDTSYDMSLDDRIAKVNGAETDKPKIFISIHANASKNIEANGFEVYSPKGDYSPNYFYEDKKPFSDTLANIMYQCLEEEFPEHNMRRKNKSQDFKEAAFKVLAKTKCYSILVENEFFTNSEMRKKMKTNEFKERVAKAYFNFIVLTLKKYKK